jgi:hypothetical protein
MMPQSDGRACGEDEHVALIFVGDSAQPDISAHESFE